MGTKESFNSRMIRSALSCNSLLMSQLLITVLMISATFFITQDCQIIKKTVCVYSFLIELIRDPLDTITIIH